MIIDFHTHCFPDKIAEYAIGKLQDNGAPNSAEYDGTVNGLLKNMDANGIDKSVVLNISTNTKQTSNVNAFALELNGKERFYAFGSVNPDSADYREQIDKLIEGGITGIKFHPFYQNFIVNDRRMFDIYEYIDSKKLTSVFHMGEDSAFVDDGRASPDKLCEIIGIFKDTRFIAAHMGGYGHFRQAFKCLVGNNVYLETSFGIRYFSENDMTELLNRHDNDRILFGSDGPWNRLGEELDVVRHAVRDKSVLDKIMYKNALALLGEKK